MARVLGWTALAIVAFFVAIWVLKVLLHLTFYVLLVALLVGGAWFGYQWLKSAARHNSR